MYFFNLGTPTTTVRQEEITTIQQTEATTPTPTRPSKCLITDSEKNVDSNRN